MTRKLYIIIMALALCMSANAQKRVSSTRRTTTRKATSTVKAATAKAPKIVFTTTSHDFGKVKYGKSKTFEFMFKNEGDANLVIVESNVFCSCMKVTIPKEPIAPGASGKIVMKFTGEQTGEFMKNAQIYTNCENSMVRLNISGEVIE